MKTIHKKNLFFLGLLFFVSSFHCFAASDDSISILAPPRDYFGFASFSAKLGGTSIIRWRNGNGMDEFIELAIYKREINESPSDLSKSFSLMNMAGVSASGGVKEHSLTGLRLDDIEVRDAYGDIMPATLAETQKWIIERGGRGNRLGPDGELISVPWDPAKDFADVYYIYKSFQVSLTSKGIGTTSRFEKLDLFCLETNKRIDIVRALEEVERQLASFSGPEGILKSLQVKIENFKDACKAFDYKRATSMISALRNELKAQRGKHVSETMFQALSKCADEFEASVRFLMNPVLPSPPAPTPIGG